jgi:hypothetical protein
MDDPSTRRSAALAALIGRAPYGRDSTSSQRTADNERCPLLAGPRGRFRVAVRVTPFFDNGDWRNVHDLFSVRNMFLDERYQNIIYDITRLRAGEQHGH